MKCAYCGAEDVQVDHDGFCQRCHDGMKEQEERRGENVASADYYLCDVCGKKTFYDAPLSYDDNNGNPEINKRWPDGDVGDMAVICKECSKTHTVIVSYEPHKTEEGETDE